MFIMSDCNQTPDWRSSPSGDSCLNLEFASVLSLEANRKVASAAAILNQGWREGCLRGVTDIVPGMVTVGLHYRPELISTDCDDNSPYCALEREVTSLLLGKNHVSSSERRLIEIPVCYGGEYGPDLDKVASACGLSADALVEIHTSEWFDVLMLGFAPGHPYIGIFDPRLSPPRLDTPRTVVKKGSIGLANRQSVIYPVDSPGGWSLIGRTPLRMFNPQDPSPCTLNMGDSVRFVAIDQAAFEAIIAEGNA
jgi:KipI family sensor histidine kinase inhibitor